MNDIIKTILLPYYNDDINEIDWAIKMKILFCSNIFKYRWYQRNANNIILQSQSLIIK